MLLLESFDEAQRSASFLALTGNTLRVREDFARLAEVALDLGFSGMLLHFASSQGGITQLEAYLGPERRGKCRACLGNLPFSLGQGNGAPQTSASMQLRGCMQEGKPFYEMSLAAQGASGSVLDAGLVLILATWGGEDPILFELRTALFEIGSQFLDHADSLRAENSSEAARVLELSLRFRDEGIEGWLSDDGPPFDPSSRAGAHLNPESITRCGRSSTEAGWFCRLLDEYEHRFDGSGNRVGFFKKVER
jgi:hypothetical protein